MSRPPADDLRALVDAERARPAPPSDAAARVAARLAVTLAGGAAATIAGVASASAARGAATATATTASAASNAARAGSAVGSLATGKAALVLGATFALGAAGGVAVDRTFVAGRAAPSAHVAAPPAPPRPSPTNAPSDLLPATPPPPDPPADPPAVPADALPHARPAPAPSPARAASATASAGPGTASDTDLGHERALVTQARTALARGDAAASLDALDRHAATFPRGRLAEERDALRVTALARLGRRDEARAAAATFATRYPKSPLLGVVKASAETR